MKQIYIMTRRGTQMQQAAATGPQTARPCGQACPGPSLSESAAGEPLTREAALGPRISESGPASHGGDQALQPTQTVGPGPWLRLVALLWRRVPPARCPVAVRLSQPEAGDSDGRAAACQP
eukprot:3929936-Rhodomonas_salina.1